MRTDESTDRDLQSSRFGRGGSCASTAIEAPSTLASDLKLFALTFAGGFLFVTVYLA
jgi:hypothetical protein